MPYPATDCALASCVEGTHLVVEADAEAAGTRLDLYVTQAAQAQGLALSRSRLQSLLADGALVLQPASGPPRVPNGAYRLRGGERITLRIPPSRPAQLVPVSMPLHILHEDADLLIVAKPAGIAVHPGAGHEAPTLVQGLMHHTGTLSHVGGVQRPGLVHRLDKDTSGALVVAKHDACHQHLTAQFAARRVRKVYLAVVHGVPTLAQARIVTCYGRHPTVRCRFTSRLTAGKQAITRYQILRATGTVALLAVALETGRTHQIRVHLAERGHPLVGDRLYGTGRPPARRMSQLVQEAGLPGQALHAAVLGLTHPRTGHALQVQAPLPPAFAALLRLLDVDGVDLTAQALDVATVL